MNTQREHARELLNHLTPVQVAAMAHSMEVMLDPLSRKLALAPIDDKCSPKRTVRLSPKPTSG